MVEKKNDGVVVRGAKMHQTGIVNSHEILVMPTLTLGAVAVGYPTESMHGAGSPQAQRIMVQRLANLEHKKALARRICGIDPDGLL